MNAKTAEKSKPDVELPPIPQNVYGLKESHNPGYWVCLPHGYTIEHLKQPHMWANIAGTGTLRAYSTVEVFTADHSEFALVYVFECGRNWASVWIDPKFHIKLGAHERPSALVKFSIQDRGPVDRYCLVNAITNEIVKSGFATEFDALRFKAEHERKIG